MADQTSRRKVIGGAVGLGVVVVAGAGGYLVADQGLLTGGPTKTPTPTTPATTGGAGAPANSLAAVADIPDGGGVVLEAQEIVLSRNGSDVKAFSSICTHAGCTVGAPSGGKIACPCHGSVFDASTGAVINGPAASPLPSVPVKVQDGQVIPG
jgi:cytochrome b6-f complex iron-sulfur subunit